ncbi:MAG: Rrf2 family transcriptional regulator [Candidatus Omnitrophota bacterium]
MKLSTKGRYGVRLMADLALHFGQKPVLLKDIAQRQDISEKYLWQLIPPLKVAGLVSSTRGVHGGYKLAKSPAQITLKDIVLVLEKPICFAECVNAPSLCNRASNCTFREIWEEITQSTLSILESFTLEKIIDKHQRKTKVATYHI